MPKLALTELYCNTIMVLFQRLYFNVLVFVFTIAYSCTHMMMTVIVSSFAYRGKAVSYSQINQDKT